MVSTSLLVHFCSCINLVLDLTLFYAEDGNCCNLGLGLNHKLADDIGRHDITSAQLQHTQDAHRRKRDHEDEAGYTGTRERFALLQVLEMSWMTTTPTKDGDELETDGTAEDCCTTLKDACGDGHEDLPSAIYTLISGVRTLQSCWT
ncbi:hypothetical protein U9M48_023857 [Paspalum notatum var. saurae]|uniref:Uncharacterized protein n=1 Tax=Paspalum notatum var. saurae TaxID=547442 RepID=A0AAQ3TQ80_PASNO